MTVCMTSVIGSLLMQIYASRYAKYFAFASLCVCLSLTVFNTRMHVHA